MVGTVGDGSQEAKADEPTAAASMGMESLRVRHRECVGAAFPNGGQSSRTSEHVRRDDAAATLQPNRWTGLELHALRLAMRMSLVDAARLVGVPINSWRQWERDGAHAVVPSLIERRLDDYLSRRAGVEIRERFLASLAGLKHPALAPTPLPMSPRPPSGSVFVWTGHEVRMLREARRMSVREFAAHLGVSDRMVSKWEAGGRNIRPRPINQQALDTSLRQADPDARERFYAALASHRPVNELTGDRSSRAGNGSPGSMNAPSCWEVVVPVRVSENQAAAITAARIAAAVGWLPGVQADGVQVRQRDQCQQGDDPYKDDAGRKRGQPGSDGHRTVMTTESSSACQVWSMPGPHTR